MRNWSRTMWALALAGTLAATPALAEVQLRLSTAAPGTSVLTKVTQQIADDMNAAFPGQVTMSVHHSSSLFQQGTELPAMQRGNLEMATSVLPEIEQQLPEYGALGAAYMFRDVDHMVNVFNSDIGQTFFDDIREKMGIRILGVGYLGTRMVNLRQAREVSGPADLNGLKMRMPPGRAFLTVAEALGATAVAMPVTEVYLALRTGAIDAQDNPTNMTRDWKFNEVTEQIILTRHLVQPVFVAISEIAWNKLSPDQQAKLQTLTTDLLAQQVADSKSDEEAALAEFRAGTLKVTDVDTDVFRKAVWEKYEKDGVSANWKPGLAEAIQAVQ